jgi:hypothetical protein
MDKFCTNCGEKLHLNNSFCQECGHKVNRGQKIHQVASSTATISSSESDKPTIVNKPFSFPIKSIIAILILITLAFTNPNNEKHLLEATHIIKKVINKNSTNDIFNNSTNDNQIMGGLALLFGDGIVDELSEKVISRENYIFFSLTKLNYDGSEKIIGLGVLNNIIIFSGFEAELDNLYNKAIEPAENNENNDSDETFTMPIDTL